MIDQEATAAAVADPPGGLTHDPVHRSGPRSAGRIGGARMTGSSRPFARGDEVIVSRPGRAQQRGVVEVVYPATRDMDRRAFVRFRDEAGNTWGETIAYRHLYQP